MKIDVRMYIRKCLPRQLKKLVRVRTRNPMVITDTPVGSFEKVALDIVGTLSPSREGNDNILTIQGCLTKYSFAVALKDATAQSVADELIERFICIFGAPVTILTDQGTDFLSKLMRGVTKRFRTTQFKTTVSNGSLEGSRYVLSEYLKQFVSQEKQWVQWLEIATFSVYITDIMTRLNSIHEIAGEKLIAPKWRGKHYYDQKANPQY